MECGAVTANQGLLELEVNVVINLGRAWPRRAGQSQLLDITRLIGCFRQSCFVLTEKTVAFVLFAMMGYCTNSCSFLICTL